MQWRFLLEQKDKQDILGNSWYTRSKWFGGNLRFGGFIMKECIFCKIIAGEIPGHVVYENEHILAFLDISQTTEGHTLIIPKVHRVDIFEMEDSEMEQVFSVVPKIARALKKSFNCMGINIVSNNGKSAGQSVFHYHVHLIPRYGKGKDKFGIRFVSNMEDYSAEELAALKERIMANID